MSLHIKCFEVVIDGSHLFGALFVTTGPVPLKVRITRQKKGGKESLVGVATWTSDGLADCSGLTDSERNQMEKQIMEALA